MRPEICQDGGIAECSIDNLGKVTDYVRMIARRTRWRLLLITLFSFLFLGTATWAAHRELRPVPPKTSESSSTVLADRAPGAMRRLAILLTPHDGPDTILYRVDVDRAFPSSTTVLHHLPDAAVKGAVLPDGEVLAIADYQPGKDRSFGSALFRFVTDGEAILLADRVAYASRPLVTREGRVFVSRGDAGPLTDGAMRVDALSVDEVNPQTGATRTVWRDTGYGAFLAGVFKHDLVVYEVQPELARLLLVDSDTGRERILLPSLPPFASSFSITNSGDVIFQDLDTNSGLWAIERLGITSDRLDILQKSQSSLSPRAWPNGEVTWSAPDGLRRFGQAAPLAISDNVDLLAVAQDGSSAAALVRSLPNATPDVVVLDSGGTEVGRFTLPTSTLFDVGGFLP